MKGDDYYYLFLHIVDVNINWELIFSYLDNPLKQEILAYIDFLKLKPTKAEFINYKLSKEALINFEDFVFEISKKSLETKNK